MRARCSGAVPGGEERLPHRRGVRGALPGRRQPEGEAGAAGAGGKKAERRATWDVPTGALGIRASSAPSSSMAPQNIDPWTLRSDVQARAMQTREDAWTRGAQGAGVPTIPHGDLENPGQTPLCLAGRLPLLSAPFRRTWPWAARWLGPVARRRTRLQPPRSHFARVPGTVLGAGGGAGSSDRAAP